MTVLLDAAEIGSRRDLHEYLQRELQLPDWYGRNLDALYDCLTDLSVDTEIRVRSPELLDERLGFYAKSLLLVLRRAAQENDRLTITIE